MFSLLILVIIVHAAAPRLCEHKSAAEYDYMSPIRRGIFVGFDQIRRSSEWSGKVGLCRPYGARIDLLGFFYRDFDPTDLGTLRRAAVRRVKVADSIAVSASGARGL